MPEGQVCSVALLIFDLDGTLVDSRRDIAKAVNMTFRDIGFPEKPDELIYSYVGDGVRRLIRQAVESEDPALLDRSLRIFEGHYLTHLLDETRLYPGMGSVLSHFQAKRKALATNKPILFTRKILRGLGLTQCFDLIIGGGDTSNLKPHPEMILKVLHSLKVAPTKAVMIGDSLNDLAAARAAGILTCAVGYGLGDPASLRAANPHFFAETVADLKVLFA